MGCVVIDNIILQASQLIETGKEPDECHFWTGPRRSSGHGYLSVQGMSFLAHRLIYEKHLGKIPDGMFVLQTCGHPLCVNIKHLQLSDKARRLAALPKKLPPRIERRKPPKEKAPRGPRESKPKIGEPRARRVRQAGFRIIRLHEDVETVCRELGVSAEEVIEWATRPRTVIQAAYR